MYSKEFKAGTARNLWIEILELNLELLTGDNKTIAEFLIPKIRLCDQHENMKNTFCLDGYSPECVYTLSKELLDHKRSGNKIAMPLGLDKNSASLFYNRGEGWGLDCVFDGIHNIIELAELGGNIVYSNHAVNLDDVYRVYCRKHRIKPKMTCFYNDGFSFHNIGSPFYFIPDDFEKTLPVTEKKLFCSFNWNPWDHRLALIVLLHYYDLLDEGYVTSPNFDKFKYNKFLDFRMLEMRCSSYIDQYINKSQIYEKLKSLEEKYPLSIDDRSQYTFTDQPLYDKELKKPIFNARVNSILEIVTETRFNGEHFFSEKTWNPVAVSKPFLIMSSYNILSSFKKKGYKSFSPFIDESYDKVKSDSHRLLLLVQELKRLSNMRAEDPVGFYKLCDNLHTIGQHNLEVFINTAWRSKHGGESIKHFLRFLDVSV